MLFTVNKSPLQYGSLRSALRIAPQDAPILLYEDGVYAASRGSESESMIREALARHPIYALDADLEARGIARLVEGIDVIGYDGFVALVEEHDMAPWL